MSELSASPPEGNHTSLDAYCLKLCTIELLCTPCKFLEVNVILIDIHLPGVNLHDSCTSLLVRERQLNFSIETARSQQSRVQDIRSICGGNNLNAVILGKTIKLIQELKHGTMNFSRLILTAASLGTNCIELINKDDGGSLLSGKLESISDHLGTITDKHLHKLWSSEFEECCLCLGRTCSRHHGLSGTWRAVHKETLRRSNTDSIESILVSHGKNDSLDKFLNLFVETTNICVLFSRSLVDLHRLDSGVILRR